MRPTLFAFLGRYFRHYAGSSFDIIPAAMPFTAATIIYHIIEELSPFSLYALGFNITFVSPSLTISFRSAAADALPA